MSDTSQVNTRIQIRIVPSAEEDDDMGTLGLVGSVRHNVLAELAQIPPYSIDQIDGQTRDGGILVLVAEIAYGIIAQKELIIQIFQTSKTVIEVLGKQQHVKAVEMTVDGDSIRIEDPSFTQVDRLISLFEAQHPGKTQQISTSSIVEITGTISKKEQSALPERSITSKDE